MGEWAIAVAVLMIAVGNLAKVEAGSEALERFMLMLWLVLLVAFAVLGVVEVVHAVMEVA